MRRITGAAIAALLVIPLAGGIAAGAVIPPGNNGPGLAAVGPVSATDGFPVWYKDRTGLRLENCLNNADPKCPAFGALPSPASAIHFPDNYPDEAFYMLADGLMETAPTDRPGRNGKARVGVQLEQAFATPAVIDGDQVTFARVRYTIDVRPGVDYKVTSPAGTKTLQAADGKIFDTEDIGIGAAGDFSGALGGRVGPFLTWDTYPTDPATGVADPLLAPVNGKATYVGDGVTEHKIKGSPYGTNFFRVEGPGINPTPTVDACPTIGGALADCIETDLFTLQGKLATKAGVTAEKATYSRSSASGGFVDVFASSEPDGPQAIQVTDTGTAPEFNTTGLEGSVGNYFARVAYAGAQPPAQVQVSNIGDVPPSIKLKTVVDQLSGTAVYTTGAAPGTPGMLTINAVSSDTYAPPPLAAGVYGALTSGSLVINDLDAPPVTVTVSSAAGGTINLPVTVSGDPAAPISVVAMAGPNQFVVTGQLLVTLDGTGSTGDVATYAWTSPPGISLVEPTTATPTFTAPDVAGAYTFTLTVTGPGGPSSADVIVTVSDAPAPIAEAGVAQTVNRLSNVTLDGSASIGAATYAWTQVLAPGELPVDMTGATTVSPTFRFPAYRFPADPAAIGALTFELVVSNPIGGQSVASRVIVTPTKDGVDILVAEYRRNKSEWRITGTSSILAGQTVVAHLGPLSGPVLGTGVIDPAGAFVVRTTTSGIVGGNGQTVSVESPLGGTATGFPVRIR